MKSMQQPGPEMAEVLSRPGPNDRATAEQIGARRLDAAVSVAAHPDLIWFNATTGQTVSWTMSGVNGVAANYLLQSIDWRLTFTADLDGDGQDDYIWENAKTGQLAVWLMKGPAVADASEIKVILQSPGWKVTQVADFNADGRDDLILLNETTGQTVMWLMNGSQILESAVMLTSADWRVVAAADLDGDQFADLVWEQRDTRAYSVWWMRGTAGKNAGVPAHKNDSERVRFAAPTMGAGRSELLFDGPDFQPHTAMGLGVVLEYGSANANWVAQAGVQGSQLSATGDVSGNGRAALVWRDAQSGATYISERLPGADSIDTFHTGTWRTEKLNSDGDWRVERTADFDGDGRSDLVWRRTSTGRVVMSLMNGLQPSVEAGLLTDPAWVVTGVRVAGKPPLARIDAQRQAVVGNAVLLDGRGGVPVGSVGYLWTLLSRPDGSQAALDDVRSAQPRFTPDVVGRYEVQLVASVGGRSSKPSRFSIDAGGAKPLGQVRLEPEWRAAGKVGNFLGFSMQLTDGLLANQAIVVDVPPEFGTLDGWRNVELDDQRFELRMEGRQLRLRLRERFGRFPAGAWITARDLNLAGVINPAAPGNYVFKISSDANPAPVAVPVRIAATDTPLDRATFTFGSSVMGAATSFSLDVTSTAGMPPGSRLFIRLPDGYDASNAKLVSATGAVSMDPPTLLRRGELIFTVNTPSAASPGGRLGMADLQVEGIRNPACPYGDNNNWIVAPTPLMRLRSTEDRIQAELAVPAVVPGTRAVEQVSIQAALDEQARWVWRLKLAAPSGLPEGGKVLIKMPQTLTDWLAQTGMIFAGRPVLEYGCGTYRSVTVTHGKDIEPGGTFDSALVAPFEPLIPPPPGSYEFEVHTSEDSKPVKVTLTVPAR